MFGSFSKRLIFGGTVTPTDISGCMLWLRPSLGITLGTTMLAAGTSPPAVTISGTLAQSCPLLLGNFTSGTLGVSTFQWSVTDGATWSSSIATAASVNLASLGIDVAFPAGTYSTDNTYHATVASWVDQSAAANVLVQATANLQPKLVYESALGGPAILASGNQRLVCATGGVTGSAAHSLFAKVLWNNAGPTGGAGFAAVGKSAGQTSALGALGGAYATWYGGSGLGSGTGSTGHNGQTLRIGKTRISAGNTVGYVNGTVDMASTSLAFNLSAGFVVGSFVDGSGGAFPSRFSHVVAHNKVLSAEEISLLDGYLGSF